MINDKELIKSIRKIDSVNRDIKLTKSDKRKNDLYKCARGRYSDMEKAWKKIRQSVIGG